MQHYYTASFIFTIDAAPIKNGYLLMDDNTVVAVSDKPIETNIALQKLDGFIVPGFVNAHCHLELSYLKNQIAPGTGLVNFVKSILAIRANYGLELINDCIDSAYEEMYANGIVAVADISNDDFTFNAKADTRIYFHTLIEAFDIIPAQTKTIFDKCLQLTKTLQQTAPNNQAHSIVPHAAYTVTPALFALIKSYANNNHHIQSMHNQECVAESQMFENKRGAFYDFFTQHGPLAHFEATGKNSLQSVLHNLSNEKTLLVHNTFTDANDIAQATALHKKLFWCFCPNANLYIENRLPDFEVFINAGVTCCLGTDSYASNYTLSLLDEIKTIIRYKPNYPFEMLLKWATLNGAQFLGLDYLGSITAGKKPGINLITNCDTSTLNITMHSTVKRLH